jgi:hypothetical protein
VEDARNFINEIKVSFDSAKAFQGIASCIVIEVPESLHSHIHPSEVMNVARECLISSFRTIVEGMADLEILKHLEICLIACTDLHKLIDKKFVTQPEGKDIH